MARWKEVPSTAVHLLVVSRTMTNQHQHRHDDPVSDGIFIETGSIHDGNPKLRRGR
jgi:hypothetical protein